MPAEPTPAQPSDSPASPIATAGGNAAHHARREVIGLFEGLLAVFFFALTLPMSRYVVREIDPISTGLLRCAIAGTLAATLLYLSKQPLPSRRQLKGLAACSIGTVYVYPVFVAWAMKYTASSHGSIVVGLLPLATAAAAALLGHDRPTRRFWAAAIAGSLIVVTYALYHGGGGVSTADLALVIAVLCSGVAYAEGGYLARSMGGWQVISWVMALNLPVVLIILTFSLWYHGFHAGPLTLCAVIFMGVFNQFTAFFGWYKAMANVGVARVSQLQLLQPFMTVVIAALTLHEIISWDTWVALLLVMGSVLIARRATKKSFVSAAPGS